MLNLEKPSLFERAGPGSELNLIFGECAACHQLHFPKTGYGCPRCGARPEDVLAVSRPGRATLLSFVTLHARLTPSLEVPCVVGEAEIAPGLIEEIMLSGAAEQYQDGMKITARAEPVERDGETVLACRFAPAEEA